MVGEGLREVTRRAVTAEIAAKAMDLFTEQGFEGTTVDQIAAAAGLPRATMLAETLALRTALLRKHLQWQEVLVPVLAERLGGDEFAAHALGSAALSCLDLAGYEWTRVAGGKPLGELLDEAIEAVSTPAR
ncbi:TetR family transcriptional regulator [Amycolatopsis sp. NPDC005232]|uniref:TetR family transcriptional regulator n=1 Tax=Amycolatopsis sp. NPDC005232 TaxID=3157027 RepID=UPI0033A7D390